MTTRQNPKTRKMFTPGQIAELVEASPRTVVKWIDQGLIKGHRLPGGQDRRVLRADVIAFLRKHDYGFALEAIGEQ